MQPKPDNSRNLPSRAQWRWLLPTAWPQQGHHPALADLHLAQGRILEMQPHGTQPAPHGTVWDVAGALVLPWSPSCHLNTSAPAPP